jgi:hypothetical protein
MSFSFRLAGALGAWALSAALGSMMLSRYETTPSAERNAPADWPAESTIPRPSGATALLMFVHPECSCTRASLEELRWVMERSEGRARVFVLVLTKPALPRKVQETEIWRTATAIPGVTVLPDQKGAEARRFQCSNSGRVLYYGADGALLFAGGLTASRGHFGESAGRDTLIALLKGASPQCRNTPVFGCPLFDVCASTGTKP